MVEPTVAKNKNKKQKNKNKQNITKQKQKNQTNIILNFVIVMLACHETLIVHMWQTPERNKT